MTFKLNVLETITINKQKQLKKEKAFSFLLVGVVFNLMQVKKKILIKK